MKKIKVKAVVLAVLLCLVIVSVVFGSDPDGVKLVRKNTPFWNVVGSTDDFKIDGLPWIEAWERETELERTVGCIAVGSAGRRCNEPMHGGHVVFDSSLVYPKAGATDHRIFILPICQNHNIHTNTREMRTAESIKALKLKNYSGTQYY
ncbi:MAG: hypothetical protein LBU88_00060 [Treponema sp.]|jgi:hypothetical protein|nr:hypothetical protein [Treponema sp.]